MLRAILVTALLLPLLPQAALAQAEDDTADVPSQDLTINSDPNMRYFLIGPSSAAPPAGYSLLVVMPGGDGSADFNPFVKRIFLYALPRGYIVAQPVAPRWTPRQGCTWPTEQTAVPGQKFSTEEFVEAVIRDVAGKHPLNRKRIFTLSWSSGGPAAYAISLREDTAVTGSFVAMSVFKPDDLPPLSAAKDRAYYIFHSPDDRVCPPRMAAQAQVALRAAGAKVRFVPYKGGHGWASGDPFGDIRKGVQWLETSTAAAATRPATAATRPAATPAGNGPAQK